jgi:hypothetical protein
MLLMAFLFNAKLFIIIILLLIVIFEKTKSKSLFAPLMGLVGACYIFISISKPGFPTTLSAHYLITTYVADLGATYGFGVFGLIPATVGLILSWKKKKENAILYYAIFGLAICSLYDVKLLLFIDLILAYYAGLAIYHLWKSKWVSDVLKNYVVLLIFCGLIFSAGSFINKLAETGPNYAEVLSLKWLKKNYESGKVLSHFEYGFLIEGISGAEAYINKKYYLLSADKTKVVESNEIFGSRDFNIIALFLSKNNIRYIWINSKMKQGQIWDSKDDGILLILQNSNNFIKIYDYLGIEIWLFSNTLDK